MHIRRASVLVFLGILSLLSLSALFFLLPSAPAQAACGHTTEFIPYPDPNGPAYLPKIGWFEPIGKYYSPFTYTNNLQTPTILPPPANGSMWVYYDDCESSPSTSTISIGGTDIRWTEANTSGTQSYEPLASVPVGGFGPNQPYNNTCDPSRYYCYCHILGSIACVLQEGYSTIGYSNYSADGDIPAGERQTNKGWITSVQDINHSLASLVGTSTLEEDQWLDKISQENTVGVRVDTPGIGSHVFDVPYTNCLIDDGVSFRAPYPAEINDKTKNKVVFVRGKSDSNINYFITNVNKAIQDGFYSVDPFKTYKDNFSFYVDLDKIDDSNVPLETVFLNGTTTSFFQPIFDTVVRLTSSCSGLHGGTGDSFYIFYVDQRTRPQLYPGYSRTVAYIDDSLTDLTLTTLHEFGHQFASLNDEYEKSVYGVLPGSFFGTSIFAENCTSFPRTKYRNSSNNKVYGSLQNTGCAYISNLPAPKPDPQYYFRPSIDSIMRSTSPAGRKFNIIDCGYIMAAMFGEPHTKANAEKYWPAVAKSPIGNIKGCAAMDVDSDGVPPPNLSTPAFTTPSSSSAAPGQSLTVTGSNFTPTDNAAHFTNIDSGQTQGISIADPNWNLTGHWGLAFGYLFGNGAADSYPANDTATATAPTLNLLAHNAARQATLHFTSSCSTETSDPATGNSDYLALEWSGDGLHWGQTARWNTFTDGSAPSVHNLPIPSALITSSFAFRFRWVTNATDNNHNGCGIKDISVTAPELSYEVLGIPSPDGTHLTFKIPTTTPDGATTTPDGFSAVPVAGQYKLKLGAFNSDWSNSLPFTILGGTPPPVLNALTPSTSAAGNAVELEGRNLKSGTYVTLSRAGIPALTLTGESHAGGKYFDITLPATLVSGIYQLTATNGGVASNALTLTVVGPPTITLSASQLAIAVGQSVTVSWSTTDATTCQATVNGSSSAIALSGTAVLTPTTTLSISLTCTGIGGSNNRSITITVVPPPTITLSATPIPVLLGGTATISWSSTNATGCAAAGAWSGALPPSGATSTAQINTPTTRTYTLTCTGVGGTTTQSFALPVVSLTAVSTDQGSYHVGNPMDINWRSTNLASPIALYLFDYKDLHLVLPIASNLPNSGSYTWTISDAVDTANDTIYRIRVTSSAPLLYTQTSPVEILPALPSITLLASLKTIDIGKSTTLDWTTTHALSCQGTTDRGDLPGWSTPGLSGSFTYTATAQTGPSITFTLTCTGDGGTASQSVQITVNASPARNHSPLSFLAALVAAVQRVLEGLTGSLSR